MRYSATLSRRIYSRLGIDAPGLEAAEARLPLLAAPEHYDLEIIPDFATDTFAGDVRISMRVLQPTARVVLHAADLRIDEARVRQGLTAQLARWTLHAPSETVTISFDKPLAPGLAELSVSYSGALRSDLRGLYLSRSGGREYAVTQLELTDARRMFPAFDEPSFKATFAMTVVVDAGDTAISNGPLVWEKPGPKTGTKTMRFGTTLPMSSYLVALAVGDFHCTRRRVGHTPLGVCAVPERQHLTGFALEAAEALLEYHNRYLAIDYPFGKLDLVAIPDFAAGAMENTGAIFFRESLLLVDADPASLQTRKRAAAVIAHEIAHQWFGNLVTMQWWDDLWLNEGFATWMESRAVHAWKPEWQMDLDAIRARQAAVTIDVLKATRPIKAMAETPAEINELFDPIAYQKGAALLHMVESYVGEDAFRGGVNAYLAAFEFDNATAENFARVLARATSKPVDRIIASFVTQPGIPLLQIDAECQAGRTSLDLTQERLRGDRGELVTWVLPVCLRLPDGTTHCEVIDKPAVSLTLDQCVPWVYGNAAYAGYYRTAYSPSLARTLTRQAGDLSNAERVGLVTDVWSQVRTGSLSIGTFLELTEGLAGNLTPALAEALAARVTWIHEYLATDASRERLERWVRDTFGPGLHPARAEDDALDEQRRTALLLMLGVAGRDPAVLHAARAQVDAYLTNAGSSDHSSPASLTATVSLAALQGGAPEYQQFLDRAQAASAPEERYRFLDALADFLDPALLRRTIEYALSSAVRSQDAARLIGAVLDNPVGRDIAWPILEARWNDLQQKVGGFAGAARIVEAMGAYCSDADRQRIRRFIDMRPLPEATRTVDQTLEQVGSCAAARADQSPALEEWLDSSRAAREPIQ